MGDDLLGLLGPIPVHGIQDTDPSFSLKRNSARGTGEMYDIRRK
jgi:hypothetical protein